MDVDLVLRLDNLTDKSSLEKNWEFEKWKVKTARALRSHDVTPRF